MCVCTHAGGTSSFAECDRKCSSSILQCMFAFTCLIDQRQASVSKVRIVHWKKRLDQCLSADRLNQRDMTKVQT